jgi:hypothetical protein
LSGEENSVGRVTMGYLICEGMQPGRYLLGVWALFHQFIPRAPAILILAIRLFSQAMWIMARAQRPSGSRISAITTWLGWPQISHRSSSSMLLPPLVMRHHSRLSKLCRVHDANNDCIVLPGLCVASYAHHGVDGAPDTPTRPPGR